MSSSESTVLLPHLLLVLQLVRRDRGGRGPWSLHSHVTLLKIQEIARNLRRSEERLNQPSMGNSPMRTEANPPQPPLRQSLHGPLHSPCLLQVQGPWPTSLGRQVGASECPLASKDKGVLTLAYSLPGRACRLESLKMVSTTQLAAINYSRPRFPQTHRLSLLAR